MGFFHLNTPKDMLEKAKRELAVIMHRSGGFAAVDSVFV
jgi:hypothetical protein